MTDAARTSKTAVIQEGRTWRLENFAGLSSSSILYAIIISSLIEIKIKYSPVNEVDEAKESDNSVMSRERNFVILLCGEGVG